MIGIDQIVDRDFLLRYTHSALKLPYLLTLNIETYSEVLIHFNNLFEIQVNLTQSSTFSGD
jgi:hypothetical protein